MAVEISGMAVISRAAMKASTRTYYLESVQAAKLAPHLQPGYGESFCS
jgi:hypothetical protein